jgi:L-amino acid N-acyltransferase YncA
VEQGGSSGVTTTVGVGVIAGKLRRRLWSAHASIAVVRALHEHDDLEPVEDLQVAFEDPATFDVLPRLLAETTGADYLQLRAVERTREARAGSLSVARSAEGEVVAFHFVHEAGDRDALEAIAPGLYPQLPEDEVLTRTVYCLPAWRGRSIEARTLVATGRLLAARGKHRAWAYLDTTNTNDLRIFREAGYAASGEERVDSYRFGRYSSTFGPLSPATRAAWDSAGV